MILDARTRRPMERAHRQERETDLPVAIPYSYEEEGGEDEEDECAKACRKRRRKAESRREEGDHRHAGPATAPARGPASAMGNASVLAMAVGSYADSGARADGPSVCELLVVMSAVSRRTRDAALALFPRHVRFSYPSGARPPVPFGSHTVFFRPSDELRLSHLEGMRELTLAGYFNRPIAPGSLPSTLERISFCDRFDAPFQRGSLPAGLRRIAFGTGYSRALTNVPPGVESIEFPPSSRFRGPLAPPADAPSLAALKLGMSFDRDAADLPRALRSLDMGRCINFFRPLDRLPQALERLTLPRRYAAEIHELPRSLKELRFTGPFHHDLATPLPSLEVLALRSFGGDLRRLFAASGGFGKMTRFEWVHDGGTRTPTRTVTIPPMPDCVTSVCVVGLDRHDMAEFLPRSGPGDYPDLHRLVVGPHPDLLRALPPGRSGVPASVRCLSIETMNSGQPVASLPALPDGLVTLDVSGIDYQGDLGWDGPRGAEAPILENEHLLHVVLGDSYGGEIRALPPRLQTLYAGSTRAIRCPLPASLREVSFWEVRAVDDEVCRFPATVRRIVIRSEWLGPIPGDVMKRMAYERIPS